jgi:hypothetical protein
MYYMASILEFCVFTRTRFSILEFYIFTRTRVSRGDGKKFDCAGSIVLAPLSVWYYAILFCLFRLRNAVPHTIASRSRRVRRPVPFIYFRFLPSFSRETAVSPRLRAACTRRSMRTPTSRTCVCTKLWLDLSSRVGANAGYVVLCARLRGHECALPIADSLSSWHRPNESLCQCWARSAQPFVRLYWTCDAVRTSH